MPVKFGPKGFTSPAIRRFRDHEPPDEGIEPIQAPEPRVRKSSAIGVVLAIAVVGITIAYVRRPNPTPTDFTAVGSIVAKESVGREGGANGLVLRVSIPLHTGETKSFAVSCDELTWQRFRRGDRVIAYYVGGSGGAPISVSRIEPVPGEVEL
ncbi:MAG: hypothetical protein HUU46_06300 [Candidatus Hydrogenedentes bacterium]|nr:hypothetical protein [Candidatus Hydrogenedentota bacterium]